MMRQRLVDSIEVVRVNGRYRRYALARLSSTIGTTVAPLGVAFAIIETGGGAAALGLVLTSGLVIFIGVTPVAGVVADRLPRLSIIVVCQLVCGVAQLLSAALVLTEAATAWSLAGLAMLISAAEAFFQPAAKGLVPQLVPPGPMLSHANALLQIFSNAVAIIGPGLAGLVIAWTSPGMIIAWDGLTFLVSAAVFLTLRLPPTPRHQRQGFMTDLAEGWSAFTSRPWLLALTLLSALTSASWAAGITLIGPLYATRYLDGPTSWGLVLSAVGTGLACGSITSLLFPPARIGLLMCATPIPEALLLTSMATNAPLPALIGAGALTGAAGTLQLITWTSYLQEVIPTEQLSRIVATTATIGTLLVPVSYATAGPLADAVGVRVVLAGCAALVVAGAAAAFCVRDVRRLARNADPS
ncbi:MFS transporter [Nonomuraea sp. SYSU D8015]|uniref:MFS transporter n=1 Tax=Nonomuraea sp. SYSU D8015 TaxID=2593644 RepID=UPI001660EAD9|nr:MFS transporter [Nonomuraea sp. SYSU D8015]